MNKFIHYTCGSGAIAAMVFFMYYLFYPEQTTQEGHLTLFFLAMLFSALFLGLDPEGSKEQKRFGVGMLAFIAVCIIIVGSMSCKSSGYGCKGKDSWNKTVKRINRPN